MRSIVLICLAAFILVGVVYLVSSSPWISDSAETLAGPTGTEIGPGDLLDRSRRSAARGDRDATFEALDLCLEHWRAAGSGAERAGATEALRFALDVARRFRDDQRLERYASQLLEWNPEDLDGLAAIGSARLHLAEYRSAEVSLRTWLALSSERSAQTLEHSMRRESVQLDLGFALLRQKRWRDALEELARLLLENPYSSRAYSQLGLCLSRLERRDSAESFFALAETLALGDAESRRAAELLDSDGPILAARFIARSFVLRGQFVEAERILREAVSTDSPGARVYLVEYLIDTLQVRKARREIERLVPLIGPSHPDVAGWTAMALDREGRAPEAARILNDLCREHDGLIGVWAPELARIELEELARPREALRWLELYLDTHDNVEARILLARSLFDVGEPGEAIDVLEATPQVGYAWEDRAGDVWLARSRLQMGQDLPKVEKALTSVSKRCAHLPEYHLALAEWRSGTDHDAAAVLSARREAQRLTTSWKEVRELCQRAARADGPDVAAHLCSAAEVLHDAGNRLRAIRFARIASSVGLDDRRPWSLLERWLIRPEEIFLRAEARRRLRSAGELEVPDANVAEMVDQLADRDR